MFAIRRYAPTDREQLRYIAMETAWKSFKKSAKMRESVAIMYNDYFTKYESENIFVAVDENDIAVGYVICSANYKQFIKKNDDEFLPEAMRCFKPIGTVHNMLLSALKRVDGKYRVHLHIDLLPCARRQGIGTKLLDTLSEHLANNGYEYMSVCGVSRYADSYKFYKKYGFKTCRKHIFGRETLTIRTNGGR